VPLAKIMELNLADGINERNGGVAIGGSVDENTPNMSPLLNRPRSPASGEPEDQQLLLAIVSGILQNNPMKRMKNDYDKRVRKGRNRKGFNLDVETEPSEDDFENCRLFLDQIRNTNCVSQNPFRFTECECLTSSSIDSEQAVEYLVYFAHLSKGIRETCNRCALGI